MSQSSEKPLVLVVSITGRTGSAITRGLVESRNFRVAGVVRPSSLSKPSVKEFEKLGVEIRPGSVEDSDASKLDELVKGVDILVLTVMFYTDQRPIILASKRQGVKRVVPSDWGPPIPRGVMSANDLKLDIWDFIREQGVGYTFVMIGWWFELLLPYSTSIQANTVESFQNVFKGDGNARLLSTSLHSIGAHVALILADPRTLNQAVIAYDGYPSFKEARSIAERITGDDFSAYPKLSKEEMRHQFETMDETTLPLARMTAQYNYSLYVREDCNLDTANGLGALDARQLYPEFIPVPFEERAKAFYKNPPRYEEALSLLEKQN
ncbi:NAD-P-binding protein [Flagelloscypha sp. PMI_526]|nr:NAD-P-binding protein [Flagelloscypha sp. PMI_526]